jgi:hypothetical protein
MESPRLVQEAQSEELLIEYRQFQVQERHGKSVTGVTLSTDNEDDIATGADGGVKLWSAGNDHYPSVRLQLWSSTPPQSREKWDRTQEETFTVSSTGHLTLKTLSGEESDASITLQAPGSYRVRVHVRGCEEAWERGEAQWFRGVEQWLLQIWPASLARRG